MQSALRDAIGERNLDILDATGIASTLMGDSIATNAFMLGFAFQKGAIPLSLEAILRAIEINGAAIEMNKQAFTWGRLAAARHGAGSQRHPVPRPRRRPRPARSMRSIAYRAQFLTDYQNKAYADRYLAAVAKVRKAETAAAPASSELDRGGREKPVQADGLQGRIRGGAALYRRQLCRRNFGEIRRRLPPEIPSRAAVFCAPRQGRPAICRSRNMARWMIHAFRLLARLKFLRGTAFDPFGRTAERKAERKLIEDYSRCSIERIRRPSRPSRFRFSQDWPGFPETIRGYGHIKEQSIGKFQAEKTRLEADWKTAASRSPRNNHGKHIAAIGVDRRASRTARGSR